MGTTKVIPVAFPFDFIVDRDGAKHGVIVNFIPGPPSAELAPYVLNGLARSLSENAVEMGVEFIEAILVFSNRASLDRHFRELVDAAQHLRSTEPLLRPKVGTLIRTNDGNHAFMPFELGVFD